MKRGNAPEFRELAVAAKYFPRPLTRGTLNIHQIIRHPELPLSSNPCCEDCQISSRIVPPITVPSDIPPLVTIHLRETTQPSAQIHTQISPLSLPPPASASPSI